MNVTKPSIENNKLDISINAVNHHDSAVNAQTVLALYDGNDILREVKLGEYKADAGKFSETDGDYAERMTGKNLFEISLDDTSYLYGWKILCVYDRSRIVQQQIIHTLIVVGINLIVGSIMLICVVFIYKSYNDRLSRLAHSMIKAGALIPLDDYITGEKTPNLYRHMK